MFDRLVPRPSFESDKSATSFKDKLRALVLPKQANTQFNLLSDAQSLHSDTWSLSSVASRGGNSPVGWAGSSSHSFGSSTQPFVAGLAASGSPSRPLPVPVISPPRPKFYPHSSSSAKSAHSLRLDPRYQPSGSIPLPDDPYLAKQLSPIAEQDHFSPERRSLALPSSSEQEVTFRATAHRQNSSLDGSEIARPSPTFSNFLSRPINRSTSQNSSTTHLSSQSSPPNFSDARSFSGVSISSRPPMAYVRPMPTIPGSTEGPTANVLDDAGSARSFVTASSMPVGITDITEEARRSHYSLNIEPATFDYADEAEEGLRPSYASRLAATGSTRSDSVFTRHWRRSAHSQGGNAATSFPKLRKPRFHEKLTPACWMFWLGFVAPWCWIVGGWYYTIRGETRPPSNERRAQEKNLALPSWIREKKGMAGTALSEKEVALHGIWFGYPFVAPSANSLATPSSDQMGNKTQPTSVLDPWIFRCRVAAWTGAALLVIAFVTAFIVVGKKHG